MSDHIEQHRPATDGHAVTGVLRRAAIGVDGPGEMVPPLPGFIASDFSPLAYAVGRACLSGSDIDGARTGVVLGSVLGDTTTADLHAQRLAAGHRHNPLLFMQATANAVLGYLTAEFAVTGTAVSISAPGDPAAQLVDVGRTLLADGHRHVLLIAVELAAGARSDAVAGPGTAHDRAAAVLLGPGGDDISEADLCDLVRLTPTNRPRQSQGVNRC